MPVKKTKTVTQPVKKTVTQPAEKAVNNAKVTLSTAIPGWNFTIEGTLQECLEIAADMSSVFRDAEEGSILRDPETREIIILSALDGVIENAFVKVDGNSLKVDRYQPSMFHKQEKIVQAQAPVAQAPVAQAPVAQEARLAPAWVKHEERVRDRLLSNKGQFDLLDNKHLNWLMGIAKKYNCNSELQLLAWINDELSPEIPVRKLEEVTTGMTTELNVLIKDVNYDVMAALEKFK